MILLSLATAPLRLVLVSTALNSTFAYSLGLIAVSLEGALVASAVLPRQPSLEIQASRSLWARKLFVSALLLVPQVIVFLIFNLEHLDYTIQLTRNLVGMTGGFYLMNGLLGQAFGWVPVVLAISVPPFFFRSASDDVIGVLTFYAQEAGQSTSLIYAVCLLILGSVKMAGQPSRLT